MCKQIICCYSKQRTCCNVIQLGIVFSADILKQFFTVTSYVTYCTCFQAALVNQPFLQTKCYIVDDARN